jgi:hypothetical protein
MGTCSLGYIKFFFTKETDMSILRIAIHSSQIKVESLENHPSEEEQTSKLGNHVIIYIQPSKLELHQALGPTMQKISKNIAEGTRLRPLIKPTLKNCVRQAKEEPLRFVGKICCIPLFGYALKNLLQGIIGGEDIFWRSSFMALFSSNAYQTGLDQTNAAEDAGFAVDGLFIIFMAYCLFIQYAQHTAIYDHKDNSYEKFVQDESLPKEWRDELYELKLQELAQYPDVHFQRFREKKTSAAAPVQNV